MNLQSSTVPGPQAPAVGAATELLVALLAEWRLVAGLFLTIPLATLLISLVVPRTYRATVSFVAESRGSGRIPSALAGLSSQLGFGSVGMDPNQSPRFYATVATSRGVLSRLLLSNVGVDARGDSTTLLDSLRVRGSTPALRFERALRLLGKRVGTEVDNQANIVTIRVDDRSAERATRVARRAIEVLNEFNAQRRTQNAREQAEFMAQRVAEESANIAQAEDSLAAFYSRNRQWQQSPALVVLEGRLRRSVELRQQVYVALKREYDNARIEEMNNTPVITVVDPPLVPQRPVSPRRLLLLVLSVLVTALLAPFVALWSARTRAARGGPEAPELAQFRATVRDIRHTFRRLGGRRGSDR